MGRVEDMALLNRLQVVHQLNEDIRAGRDPYPRLKQEYEYWESSENMLKGGAEELLFLDEVLRTLLASRPVPVNLGLWMRRLNRSQAHRELQSA
ncbi:MAG TPA: hypothetical protein VNZ54_00800 [bacterium]|jgi:hypothetical protein|nr:hypothetical protein [bacterium]HXC64292.1 hypothetical protein [bacterium]